MHQCAQLMIHVICFEQCSLIQRWLRNFRWEGQRHHTLLTMCWQSFFAQALQDKLKSTESFVICFDESLNQVVQRGQMDLVVRYFDDAANQVITKYLTSVFLGRATATDLLVKFKEGIPRSLLVMRSRYHYGKLSKWYWFCLMVMRQ